ncbi:hypothetical protein D3C72_1573330 [compost metagenome]
MDQDVSQGALFIGAVAGFLEGGGTLEGSDFATQATLGAHQLEAFGDPDGPGDDRGDGQADHDDLDHDVGVFVHAPWGQVVGHAQAGVFDQCFDFFGFADGLTINWRGGSGGRACSRIGLGGWLAGAGHSRGYGGSGSSGRSGRLIGQCSRGHDQAEHQRGNGAPCARRGWRSGRLNTCHAGRT